MIDISSEDFGTLCICALRYCHGRRTYMPSLVQEIVTTHFKDLDNRTLSVIADDERFQKDMELWGDNCDKVDWQKFYRSLEQFRVGLEQTDCAWAAPDEPRTDICDECIFVKGSGWCNNCNGKPKGLDALPKKDEPQTIAEDINRRVEMVKKEWNARHIEDEPQTVLNDYSKADDCMECEKFFDCDAPDEVKHASRVTDCAWK